MSIPNNRGFALVGNADTGNILWTKLQLRHSLLANRSLRLPDFFGVMLDPARLRKQLPEFPLRHGDWPGLPVIKDTARAAGALIYG
jgi:hypothetical protein